MNRRNFLKTIGKICAVLPFVGSSSAVAKTGASEGQPKAPMCATEVAERYGASPIAGTLPEIEKLNNFKKYYVHYDFETKVQTVIEDEEIVSTRKFKEDPFVMFNPDPKISYVIFKKYRMI